MKTFIISLNKSESAKVNAQFNESRVDRGNVSAIP